jgi:uncharacterized protein (TIGR01319 family)
MDFLTLEVGSTITKANGFTRAPGGGLEHVAQGFAPTTVPEGDVSLGVEGALADLRRSSGYDAAGAECWVNSSAAGGLRVTVHGLTMSMTARAAKEASLGAGAIIKKLTAGPLTSYDLGELLDIAPNLVVLAGGVDHGDTQTVMENAAKLLGLPLRAPVVYAGNAVLQQAVRALAAEKGREVWVCENVFPEVDVLNVAPLRRVLHNAFAQHIIHAPGMERIARYTRAPVLPTPGAVLLAARALAESAGDALVVDVGGATTDVHSVTEGSPEYARLMVEPEPHEKRTVEGDLGVYVNAANVLALDATGTWMGKAHLLKAMPSGEQERDLTRWLCQAAVVQAVQRHAGTLSTMYTATGTRQVVRGRDLTNVKWVVGTGGALTRVAGGEEILRRICLGVTTHLLPPPGARVVLDRNYLLSALGTLAQRYPAEATAAIRHLVLPEAPC